MEQAEILRMSYGSAAVGKIISGDKAGMTVFVEGATPGDICEVEIVQDKGRYVNAIIPCCEIDPEVPWAHLSYEKQLEAKSNNIIEALVRVGGVPRDKVNNIVKNIIPSKNEWAYRNKLEFDYDNHKPKVHKLGNSLISETEKAMHGALNYLSHGEDLGIYRLSARGSTKTNSLELAIWTTPCKFPRAMAAKVLQDAMHATSIVRIIGKPGLERKIRSVEVLSGDGFWRESLGTYKYFVSAPSFFQVNTEQAEMLQNLVLEAVCADEVLDLYSGCGTFTLPLAAKGIDVTAVELAGSSTRDLKRNLEINNLEADVICDDVGLAIKKYNLTSKCVLVDPPKQGIEKTTLEAICKTGAEQIIYVSCDPQTLARDIARFAARGYNLEQVQPVDMFPQTYHVETVVLMSRVEK